MKTFSIGEVAAHFGLPISTLHYYDRQGLLPFVSKNTSGQREFTAADLNLIQTICCLKGTEMPIKEIRQYIDYVMAGPATIAERQQLLRHHKERVLAKQQQIEHDLVEIDKKIAKYDSPAAPQMITRELQFAAHEKEQHHLANPYH
ncbi:MerR family transcriptional regulator [Lactobacillus selangorensis]|nr:MerR family transcriptional regulator [Lactobacillus selangorensis]